METNPNDYATIPYGTTKLEYFASNDNTPIPEQFYREKLREFNKAEGCIRSTESHPMGVMTLDEIVEVKAAWKVKMAKALINELNKQQNETT